MITCPAVVVLSRFGSLVAREKDWVPTRRIDESRYIGTPDTVMGGGRTVRVVPARKMPLESSGLYHLAWDGDEKAIWLAGLWFVPILFLYRTMLATHRYS